MENIIFDNLGLEFEDKILNSLISEIESLLKSRQNNFFELCKYFNSLYEYCKGINGVYYIAKNGNSYTFTSIVQLFGLSKSTAYNMVQVYKKFNNFPAGGTNCRLDFFRYSPSKLFELLRVSDAQLQRDIERGILTYKMTKKEIRDYVKSLKGSEGLDKVLEGYDEDKEENEEDIPMVFDYKQKYEFSYFEKLSKNQAINIAWDLYIKINEKRG